jgi:hypothetical protein
MNSSFKKIQENNAAKLREASKKDTNKMWKILNNMNGCKKESRVDKYILKVRNNIIDAVICNIIKTQHCIEFFI